LFDTVGIVARPDKEEAIALAKSISTFLSSKGRKVWLSHEIASKVDKFTLGSAAEFSSGFKETENF
jgi:NAD kinase